MSTLQKGFVHTVLFWLKDKHDAPALSAGLHTLAGIDAARATYIGTPANTNRPVIDSTYDFCLTLVFDSEAAHDIYQSHPIHVKFVEENSHLWSRVLIYDAE